MARDRGQPRVRRRAIVQGLRRTVHQNPQGAVPVGRLYDDVEDLRHVVLKFTRRYNDEWLIERHGHCTPREAYPAAMESRAA